MQNNSQDAANIMSMVFQNARDGVLSDQDFLFVLARLLDSGNQNLALELATAWNNGKKK